MRILAVLNLPATAPAVLRAADQLATRLDATLLVLHVLPGDDHVPGEELVPRAERARHAAAAVARSTALRAMVTQAGLDAAWREVAGPTAPAVAAAAAEAELVVLGRVPSSFYEDAQAALHAALLDAEAPVLLPGDAAPTPPGRHVAVAWKPSGPAERAIAAALPLLLRAERVTVLMATEGDPAAEPPTALLDDLGRAGVPCAVHRLTPAGPIGAALLDAAAAQGADLLVMGAFSHGRMQEMMFGGTTREVLHESRLPILLHC